MNFTPSKLHKSSVSIHAENQSYRRIKKHNGGICIKVARSSVKHHLEDQLKKMKDATAEEIALANREFLSLRQKELCQLLKDDKARYEKELQLQPYPRKIEY
ncbi:hypothetical protein BSLG_005982 [Batrachochytrium salamandrivorans]|nr:hypothetical protein BSLG_005982 [Batrachochytrium salamandrivorans]